MKYVMDEKNVTDRSEKIRRRWDDTVDGVYFGSDCNLPKLVPIPVRKRSEPPRMTDYQTSAWIVDDFRGKRWSSLNDQVVFFDVFPEDDCVPQGTYYVVIFDGQDDWSHFRFNKLCHRLNYSKGPEWYGGVLVMRFSNDIAKNMTASDMALAKGMVSTYVCL